MPWPSVMTWCLLPGRAGSTELRPLLGLAGPLEKVVVAATLELYEGATCSSNDNDGEDYRVTSVAQGQSRKVDLAVNTLEWGSDDEARASFFVIHRRTPAVRRFLA
ncbi:hypothetical protein [Streptomyces sp. NPDC059861]|uniref:hypothetical protein n=1 Tax=Streptomyces sp. NPDC059861 TaxID=3346974 RepID=UPI003648560C